MGKSAASLILSISRFSYPRIVTAQNTNHTSKANATTSKAKWFSAVFFNYNAETVFTTGGPDEVWVNILIFT